MKIRIEGCTAEELKEWSPYLIFGKEYQVGTVDDDDAVFLITDEDGDEIVCLARGCAHLPRGAKWVEVTE